MNAAIEYVNAIGGSFIKFAWPMLIQVSVLIVILLLADLLLRKRLRAVFRYWLWMLVLIKLLLPVSLSTPASLGTITGNKLNLPVVSPRIFNQENQHYSTAAQPAPTETQPRTVISEDSHYTPSPKPILAAAAFAPAPILTWQAVVFLIWLVVITAMLLLLIQRVMFVYGLIKQSQKANSLLTDALEFCRKKIGLKQKVSLKVSPNATSPAVCGLFRPVILIPNNLAPSLGSSHLRAVLMHELAHIKRGDLWINVAQTLLQIIYFYNPLLWLANAVIRRVREQAVDETVQVALAEKATQYPETLLNVAKLAFERPALSLRLVGVVESKNELKARIKKMLEMPVPKTAKLGIVGLIIIIITAIVLLPMAAAEKSSRPMENSEFTATFPNGVTVELVGTCQYTKRGISCYRPDGLPLARKLKIAKWNQKPKAGDIGFMFKVDGPEDMSLWYHGIEAAESTEASCEVIGENGEKLQGWEAVLTRLDDNLVTTKAKFGAAAGPWETVAEHDGKSMGIDNGISFTEAVETEKGVQIYTTDTLGRDVTQRIVAVDNEGTVHPWRGHTGSVSNSEIRQSIGTFPNLNLKQISEFQFQTRPYQWVTFKNVSLEPGHKTDVQIETEQTAEDTENSEFKTALLSDVSVENHHKLLMERRDILQKILQDVEQKYDAGRANSRELQEAKIDLLRVESELAETPEIRINILNQVVTMYLEQEKTTKLLLDAGRTTQNEFDKIKLLRLEAETEFVKAMEETKKRQANLKATEDTGLTEKKAKDLVEDFFKHNYRDITARKTIEWGWPTTDENGNLSIRYKYEATIWGRDKIIENKVFTFDKDGKYLSAKSLEGFPEKVDGKTERIVLPHNDGESAGKKSVSQNPLGKWKSVDFVRNIEDFEPGEKQFRGELYLERLNFYKDGTTSGSWTWKRGSLYHSDDKTTAEYEIREIDGNKYLFMEWMSGDVIIRGQKPEFYVLKKIGSQKRNNASRTKRIEISNDDGKNAGKWSFSGGGHGVKFTAPSEGCILKAVRLYGSRYGEYKVPDENFDVWVCDKNFNVIENFEFPYSLFKKRGYSKWVTMKLDDVQVSKEFAICVAFDPHKTKGIYVFHDAKTSRQSYQGIPPEMEPFKDGDWMIRALIEQPAEASLEDTEISDAGKMAAENLTSKGWKLWNQRKLIEAEETFKEAVQKDPTNANAWNGLGWSQQNRGKKINAKYSFRKCLEIEPNHAAALNGLGWIAKGQGETDEAIEYWQKAVQVSDGHATASLSGLTQTYMELEQYNDAIKYYKMWLNVEPQNDAAKAGLERARTLR